MSPMQPTLSIRYCLPALGIIILLLSASDYCPLPSPMAKWNHDGGAMTEALNVEEALRSRLPRPHVRHRRSPIHTGWSVP